MQFNRDFLKELLKDVRIPKDIGLKKCIQCGNCSSACPAARYTDYRPRKLIHDILTGQKEKILQSEDIWYCYSCFSCNLRCPRNNNPGFLIHVLRDLARKAGHGWQKVIPFKKYLTSLRDTGLGLTPESVPSSIFAEELGKDWTEMKQNLPNILTKLGMQPVVPRELPSDARSQIKEMLELAGINEEIEKYDQMEKKIARQE